MADLLHHIKHSPRAWFCLHIGLWHMNTTNCGTFHWLSGSICVYLSPVEARVVVLSGLSSRSDLLRVDLGFAELEAVFGLSS